VTGLVPWRVREAVAGWLGAGGRRKLAAARAGISLAPVDDPSRPVLGFGGLLDDGRLIHGGAVKLLTLRRAFPADESRFTILYLVSSALPPDPAALVELARSRGIRFVWNQNGVGYPGWAGREHERHNAPMRRLRAMADFVVYQSAFCKDCADRFLGPAETPARLLLNPVDLAAFSPGPPLPPEPLRLLAMGTQNYPDRVLRAIDALAELRAGGTDARLTIAGRLIWPGAAAEVSRHIARRSLGAHVELLPAFTQAEAPAIYRSHHILLHPKYKDPCPTVVAEALACGLPVVGSNSGGLPEMTDPACARLIDLPDTWDHLPTPSGPVMAAAVGDLAANLPQAARAARAAAMAKFDSSAWTASHREIFQSVLAPAA